MTAGGFSSQQRAVLCASDWKLRPGAELLNRAGLTGSTEGLHQTAASLVRRGLLAKARISGTVHYQWTDAGHAQWRTWRQRERRAQRRVDGRTPAAKVASAALPDGYLPMCEQLLADERVTA